MAAAAFALKRARERQTRRDRTFDVEKPEPDTTSAEARREFGDVAHKFSGLYESLHRVCVESADPEECRMVLSEWEVRLTHGGGDAVRRAWQSTARDVAGVTEFGNGGEVDSDRAVLLGATWLELLRSWGVERDEREIFALDGSEHERYRVSGTPQTGEPVRVELPCWTHQGTVLEQGIVKVPVETE